MSVLHAGTRCIGVLGKMFLLFFYSVQLCFIDVSPKILQKCKIGTDDTKKPAYLDNLLLGESSENHDSSEFVLNYLNSDLLKVETSSETENHKNEQKIYSSFNRIITYFLSLQV